ncbi:MAG: hypothetical protein JSW61_04175 [Candidatus Thorarchaeota archaeon]|nr:MAG: hypothetical protein JSW61_04175 [Candidatus Thorarchaeota archaeon]
MSQEDTYVRAKLTEINSAIERLTEMLNRMIEVISKITEVQDAQSDISLGVTANSEKIDELMQMIQNLPTQATSVASARAVGDMGTASTLQAVLDTLESQIREGVIASDLAKKISDSADMMEQRGGSSQLVVKMKRWTRILRTYGRVDPISPADLTKLRGDLKEWGKEVAKMR